MVFFGMGVLGKAEGFTAEAQRGMRNAGRIQCETERQGRVRSESGVVGGRVLSSRHEELGEGVLVVR
jgi:hypothetical protein